MSEIIEEEERHKSIKVLNDLLDEFIEERYNEFKLVFDRPLDLSEKEYYELIGNYDSSNGAEGVDVFIYDLGVFENTKTGKCYKVSKVLEIELNVQENGVYTIYKIVGYTDTPEAECRDSEG
jgi:hypothetical protein